MAKKAKSKKTETPPEVPAESPATETVTSATPEAPAETAVEQSKPAKKTKATEPDEGAAASLKPFQCPRCKGVNSVQNVIGTPFRKARRGFHGGKEYSAVTQSQVLCGQCGDTFIQSDYQ